MCKLFPLVDKKRMQQFFDYYLMGAPMPVWMKSEIPYARKGNYFGYETAK